MPDLSLRTHIKLKHEQRKKEETKAAEKNTSRLSEGSSHSQFKELGIEAKYKTILEDKEEIIVDKDNELMQRDIALREKDQAI